MPAHVDIPDGDIDQDSPITVALMTAFRDNLAAAAEQADGSPLFGGVKSIQIITASGTWTRPANVRAIEIFVTGGGVSGASGGPGGNASATSIKAINVTDIATATVTIAGIAGTSTWSDGVNTVTNLTGGDINLPGGNGSNGGSLSMGGAGQYGNSPAYGGGGAAGQSGAQGVIIVVEYR